MTCETYMQNHKLGDVFDCKLLLNFFLVKNLFSKAFANFHTPNKLNVPFDLTGNRKFKNLKNQSVNQNQNQSVNEGVKGSNL